MMLVGVILETRELVTPVKDAVDVIVVAEEDGMTSEEGIVAVGLDTTLDLDTTTIGPVLDKRELLEMITELEEVIRGETVEAPWETKETFEEDETFEVGVLLCDNLVTEEMELKWLKLIVTGLVVLVDKVEVKTELGVEIVLLIEVAEDVFFVDVVLVETVVVTFRLDLTFLVWEIVSVTVFVMTSTDVDSSMTTTTISSTIRLMILIFSCV